MGKGCSPENLAAAVIAEGQRSGVDPFAEADRLKSLSANQKAYYELAMSDLMGFNPAKKPNGVSVFDVLQKSGVKTKAQTSPEKIAQLADGQLYDNPSLILPKKFYDSVDKRLTDFVNQSKGLDGKATQKKYGELVGSPVRKVKFQLDKAIKGAKNRKQLEAKLKGFGLTPETAYEAREWLSWLGQGGHLQTDNNVLKPLAERLGRAMANFNLLWSGGNIADTTRVFSNYAPQKGGMKAISETILENVKSNPFKRRADLAKKGIYSYQGGAERIDFGNSDPFAWTLTLQKNLAHDLDVKMGGNGTDAIENLIFDTKPWNVPRLYRVKDPTGLFSLVRYPINESRWLVKEHLKVKDAILSGDTKAIQDSAAPLLTYLGLRTVILGADSNIPEFIYSALPNENEELPLASKKFWKDVRQASLVHGVGNAALKAAGIPAELDLTTYFQPFGGKLAVRYGLVSDTLQKIGKSGTKGMVKLLEGRPDVAALDLAVAASALNNVLGLGQTFKALGGAGKVVEKVTNFGDKANATIITKVLDTTAKALDEEYTGGRFTRELLKDIAGSQRVRKGEGSSGGKRAGRPSKPKRPKRKRA